MNNSSENRLLIIDWDPISTNSRDPHTFSEGTWTLHAYVMCLPFSKGMWIHNETLKHVSTPCLVTVGAAFCGSKLDLLEVLNYPSHSILRPTTLEFARSTWRRTKFPIQILELDPIEKQLQSTELT